MFVSLFLGSSQNADAVHVQTLWPPDIHKDNLVGRVWEIGEYHRPVPVYPEIHGEELVSRVWEVGEIWLVNSSDECTHES